MIYDENIWTSPTRQIESVIELKRRSMISASGDNLYLDSICLKNTDLTCKVRSKNLIPYPYAQDNWIEINGLTFELLGDGGIYVHGAGNQPVETVYLLQTLLFPLAPGSYVLSGSDSFFNPITSNEELRLDIYSADGSRFEGTQTSGVFTITEEKLVRPYLYFGMGARVDAVYYPMISVGNSYNGLADYSMYTPPSAAIVTVQGAYNSNSYAANPDGTVEGIEIDSHYAFINVEPKGAIADITYNCFYQYNNFSNNDSIKQITVERTGSNGKFFGFGVGQKANFNLIDKERLIDIQANTDSCKVLLQTKGATMYANSLPTMYVTDVVRDENTNELSITAYDVLYGASEHTTSEINISAPYTIREFANKCATLIGASGIIANEIEFDTDYFDSANLEGTETIREVLDAIAEVTQTLYYIDSHDMLVFKRLDKDGEPVLNITKHDYFMLDSGEPKVLANLASVTELGENYEAKSGIEGVTQYLRNNPFIENNPEVTEIIETALAKVAGFVMIPYNCTWRGNPALEPGDKIAITTKDDNTLISYVISDKIIYNGGLKQETSWSYEEQPETHTNPTNLGEVIKKTFAKVDKVNQDIEIVAAETAALRLDADSITASVSDISARVETKVTASDVSIAIQNELADGVNKVTTSTGFTFNDEGLRITKTNSEIQTLITEDGMKIYKGSEEVLTADNAGVKATDLHATTYLIIGTNSRLEDYGGGRTACFWIG